MTVKYFIIFAFNYILFDNMNEIIERLQLTKYNKKLVLNKPDDINMLDVLKPDINIKIEKYDLIVIFVFSLGDFADKLQMVIREDLLNPDGSLFFVYPKKGNKKYKEYIGRDDFFEQVDVDDDGYVKGSLLKFFKMVAFDEVFTMIGLTYQAVRKVRRNQPSQCVGDYIDRIPDVQKYFANNEEILSFYNSLTPGYQRGWARYVYSTKSQETIVKRFVDMEDIIKQGYKSVDLYRAAMRLKKQRD